MASLTRRKARLDRLLEARRRAEPAFEPKKHCHVKQARLVDSLVLGRARSVCALASRQSGKSHGSVMAALLMVRASTFGGNVIYVTSTKDTVRKMAFEPARAVNDLYNLGGKVRGLSIWFKGGGTVYFMGADSDKATKRLRGTPNLIGCFIDEAGIYSSDQLRSMIDTVRPGLTPRLGKLVVLGTPSLEGPQGTWFDIVGPPGAPPADGYEKHEFSYLDNDRVDDFANIDARIDEDLKSLGYTRTSAYFLREYKCIFVVELSERVYQLTETNYYDGEPPDDLTECVVGGDVGVSDADALLSLRWNKLDPRVWVGDEQEASGQDALEFGTNVAALNKLRRPFKIAVDPGGGGKKTIITVQKQHPGIPIKEADKPAVAIQVRAVNMLAQSGRLRVRRGSKLALELARATWVDGLVGGEIDEHGKHSDLVPALRYACVAATPYLPRITVSVAEAPEVTDRKAEWAAVVAQAKKAAIKKPLARVVLGRRPAA